MSMPHSKPSAPSFHVPLLLALAILLLLPNPSKSTPSPPPNLDVHAYFPSSTSDNTTAGVVWLKQVIEGELSKVSAMEAMPPASAPPPGPLGISVRSEKTETKENWHPNPKINSALSLPPAHRRFPHLPPTTVTPPSPFTPTRTRLPVAHSQEFGRSKTRYKKAFNLLRR
jgi:hypothetical protein